MTTIATTFLPKFQNLHSCIHVISDSVTVRISYLDETF